MSSKLAQQIKLSRPLRDVFEEAHLAIILSSSMIGDQMRVVLQNSEITTQQYNALRILRGSAPEGLPCSEVCARMLTKDSDITRLLDRLEKSGLVERERCTMDRRVVRATITPKGQTVLDELDPPLLAFHQQLWKGVSQRDATAMVRVFDRLRDNLREMGEAGNQPT